MLPLLQGILGSKCLAEGMTAAGCKEFWEREYFYLRTALLIAPRDSGEVTNVSWVVLSRFRGFWKIEHL